MTDWTLGLGLGGIAIIAIVLVLIGWYGKSMGIPTKPRGWMKTIGILLFILVILAYANVFTYVAPEEEEIVDVAEYDITVTESMSHVTFNDATNEFTMALSFNDTSDAFVSNTQYLQANFTLMRADVLLTDAIARGVLGEVELVDVTGAADEYIMSDGTNGFDFVWTKLGSVSTYEDCSVLVEAGGSNWVVLNITLNAAAVASMSQYEISCIDFTLGGQYFVVNCMKATVST